MPEDRAGKEDTAERLLTENREVVLQLHGGGYIGKMKNAYRDFAVLYARMPGERAFFLLIIVWHQKTHIRQH